jgi:hypothetical protein
MKGELRPASYLGVVSLRLAGIVRIWAAGEGLRL